MEIQEYSFSLTSFVGRKELISHFSVVFFSRTIVHFFSYGFIFFSIYVQQKKWYLIYKMNDWNGDIFFTSFQSILFLCTKTQYENKIGLHFENSKFQDANWPLSHRIRTDGWKERRSRRRRFASVLIILLCRFCCWQDTMWKITHVALSERLECC